MRTLNTEEQRAKWRAAYHRTHPKKAPRVFYHEALQRIVTRDHCATRIFWNRQMLDTLRRDFATTPNEELAGVLGVSVRTMIRKARELGLEKDRQWFKEICNANLRMANACSNINGNAGRIKKGEHRSPATEFKKRNNTE